MNCNNCGIQLPEGAVFCVNCGSKLTTAQETQTVQQNIENNQTSQEQNGQQFYQTQQPTNFQQTIPQGQPNTGVYPQQNPTYVEQGQYAFANQSNSNMQLATSSESDIWYIASWIFIALGFLVPILAGVGVVCAWCYRTYNEQKAVYPIGIGIGVFVIMFIVFLSLQSVYR